jgi:hypothetical protein
MFSTVSLSKWLSFLNWTSQRNAAWRNRTLVCKKWRQKTSLCSTVNVMVSVETTGMHKNIQWSFLGRSALYVRGCRPSLRILPAPSGLMFENSYSGTLQVSVRRFSDLFEDICLLDIFWPPTVYLQWESGVWDRKGVSGHSAKENFWTYKSANKMDAGKITVGTFTIYTLKQILLEWSDKGEFDELGM